MTIQKTFFVAGATGATGGGTVRRLLQKGYRVRAYAHSDDARSDELRVLGAEVVVGDLLDFGKTRAALEGVDRAYFVFPIMPGLLEATTQFAQSAREVGVEAIVNMSQISARRDATSNGARLHWLAEQILNWSGVPTTHIRPTFFAEWLLYLAPAIRNGTLPVMFTDGRHAPVAAEDQAAVIAAVLSDPAPHAGKVYPLYGPTEYDHGEIADVLADELGHAVAYKQIDETQLGTIPRMSGKPFLIQHLVEVAKDHTNGIFAGTNDLVETIGNQKPTSLGAFIQANVSHFR